MESSVNENCFHISLNLYWKMKIHTLSYFFNLQAHIWSNLTVKFVITPNQQEMHWMTLKVKEKENIDSLPQKNTLENEIKKSEKNSLLAVCFSKYLIILFFFFLLSDVLPSLAASLPLPFRTPTSFQCFQWKSKVLQTVCGLLVRPWTKYVNRNKHGPKSSQSYKWLKKERTKNTIDNKWKYSDRQISMNTIVNYSLNSLNLFAVLALNHAHWTDVFPCFSVHCYSNTDFTI